MSRDDWELKRKLREIKKLETDIRFGNNDSPAKESYVWSRFFSTKPEDDKVLYPYNRLVNLEKEEFKEVVAEYFSAVYFVYYKENGILPRGLYDPELLQRLHLSADATSGDIKKRFRELVKKCHPDYGGSSRSFIELMDIYRRLIDGSK